MTPTGGNDAGPGGSTSTGGTGNLPNTTIWIAGDSTVMTYAAGNTDGTNGTTLEGWGQELGQFFSGSVTIDNQAIGGRSVAFFMWSVVKDGSGTYQCIDDQGTPEFQLDSGGNRIDSAQWARIKNGIKPGDFLLIQFGTNDETHTCPRYVSLADFETDFGIMADAVRAKGATPIFVTPMGHRSFSGTTVTNTLLPYANAMKDEATKETVEVEDLNLRSVEYYESAGNSYLATNIFDGGTTHFIKAGAVEMADLIAGEVRRNNGPLAAYLK
jgi:lysophospholipase L1-like esterase